MLAALVAILTAVTVAQDAQPQETPEQAVEQPGQPEEQPAEQPTEEVEQPGRFEAPIARTDTPGLAGERTPTRIFNVRTDAKHAFRTNLDGDAGSVEVTSADIGLDLILPRENGNSYRLSLDAGVSQYDFNDATDLAPNGSPWDNLVRYKFLAGGTSLIDDRWSLIYGGELGYAGETDATFLSGISFSGRVWVNYQLSDDFSIGGGLGVRTRLENSPLLFPSVIFNWHINDRWTLGSELRGVALTYQATDTLQLKLGAGWEYNEYRLEEDNVVPDGVFTDERLPVSLSMRWAPTRRFALQASGGVDFAQRYQIRDSSGDRLTTTRTKPQPFLMVNAAFRF